MEGFEHYLESLFGSKESKTMTDGILDKVRKARNIRGDEVLKKEIDKLPNIMDNVPKEPKVSMKKHVLQIFHNK